MPEKRAEREGRSLQVICTIWTRRSARLADVALSIDLDCLRILPSGTGSHAMEKLKKELPLHCWI